METTDYVRPEYTSKRRIVTGVKTVDFTSRKIDENGEPTGKELHMEYRWNAVCGESRSHGME